MAHFRTIQDPSCEGRNGCHAVSTMPGLQWVRSALTSCPQRLRRASLLPPNTSFVAQPQYRAAMPTSGAGPSGYLAFAVSPAQVPEEESPDDSEDGQSAGQWEVEPDASCFYLAFASHKATQQAKVESTVLNLAWQPVTVAEQRRKSWVAEG